MSKEWLEDIKERFEDNVKSFFGGRGMIKTKEFYGGGIASVDEQINEFLQKR